MINMVVTIRNDEEKVIKWDLASFLVLKIQSTELIDDNNDSEHYYIISITYISVFH